MDTLAGERLQVVRAEALAGSRWRVEYHRP